MRQEEGGYEGITTEFYHKENLDAYDIRLANPYILKKM